MKKICITGAAGFIGSHLTEYCVERGFKVKAFIRYTSTNTRGWLENSPCQDDIEFVTGDVRDMDAVERALDSCDTVFHLAALIGIPYSYVSPLAYIRTNIEGTNNVLHVAKNRKMENIIITSTSETYGTAQYVPIDEKHPAVGQSPYAASKIGADQIALSYYRSFGTPVKIARPFNTYGPRQSARAIIPTIITQILKGKKEIMLGNTAPTRDFTFVKDTVKGLVAIAESNKMIGEAANIGNNKEISVGDLANLIMELIGEKVKIISDDQRVRPGKSEVERLVCNNAKLTALTGWKPQYGLRDGLQETVRFIESCLNLYKAELYNV